MSGEGVSLAEAEFWTDPEGVHVQVVATNEGKQTLFVTCEVRQMQFTGEGNTVVLCFSDHGRDPSAPGRACRTVSVPSTKALAPGESLTLGAVIPAVVHQIRVDADGQPEFVVHEAAEVSTIEVRVTQSERPFYFSPKGQDPLAQVIGWGDEVSCVAVCVRPPADRDPKQAPP